MLQIIIQGRGGQGAQTAGNLLAMAFFAQARQVQCFASYGGARRGTPVSSYIRVDDKPVRVRCDIERADAILCFDASLLEGRLLAAAHAGTLIVVNSAHERDHFAAALPGYRVIPVDGLAIARRNGLGRIVNSALLGAFARAVGAPALDVLTRTLVEQAPKLTTRTSPPARKAIAGSRRNRWGPTHERHLADPVHLDHRQHGVDQDRHLARCAGTPHPCAFALPCRVPGGRRHRRVDRPGARPRLTARPGTR